MKHFLFSLLLIIVCTILVIIVCLGTFAFLRPQETAKFFQGLTPSPTPIQLKMTGVGIIGDSLSDEYRADDNRGYTYASSTLNWVEILAKYRSFPSGEWGIYEEPRRQGYAYNYARTGEDIAAALDAGQHVGLKEQIERGKINTVIIYLGVNDFSPLAPTGYEAIYSDTLSDAQLTQKINRIVADMQTIIQTLQGDNENRVQILLVTIPDWGEHALVKVAFPLPDKRARVSEAIDLVNTNLKSLATQKHIAIADISEFYADLATYENDDVMRVGAIQLNKYLPGDDPRDLFLDDGVHPGTIYNGLFANFIIEELQTKLGVTLSQLSDQEIVSIAGL